MHIPDGSCYSQANSLLRADIHVRFLFSLLPLLVLFAWDNVPAAGPEFVKVERRDTLPTVMILEPSCGFTRKQAQEVVDGVLARSRLKTREFWPFQDSLALEVTLDCSTPSGAYVVGVKFLRLLPSVNRYVFERDTFLGYGIAGKDVILEVLQKFIEEAAALYMESNFDLVPK